MTQYRLVAGVLGIIFDDDSEEEAKRQFDLLVRQSKTARSASDARQLRYSRMAKLSLNIALLIVGEI